jgi:hypothetical protein
LARDERVMETGFLVRRRVVLQSATTDNES